MDRLQTIQRIPKTMLFGILPTRAPWQRNRLSKTMSGLQYCVYTSPYEDVYEQEQNSKFMYRIERTRHGKRKENSEPKNQKNKELWLELAHARVSGKPSIQTRGGGGGRQVRRVDVCHPSICISHDYCAVYTYMYVYMYVYMCMSTGFAQRALYVASAVLW